tara:strand:- start:201 stop:437 length:237 start_codon:yes stop_codon:yes gene_type:complete
MDLAYSIQLIFTLSVLGVVLYFALRYAKQYQLKHFNGDIEILDRRAIDHGVVLLIVKVQDKKYLLSTANKDIKLISEL